MGLLFGLGLWSDGCDMGLLWPRPKNAGMAGLAGLALSGLPSRWVWAWWVGPLLPRPSPRSMPIRPGLSFLGCVSRWLLLGISRLPCRGVPVPLASTATASPSSFSTACSVATSPATAIKGAAIVVVWVCTVMWVSRKLATGVCNRREKEGRVWGGLGNLFHLCCFFQYKHGTGFVEEGKRVSMAYL